MNSLVSRTWHIGAVIGLALTPIRACAVEAAAVSYNDAMACSAMFALISTSSDTAEDEHLLIDQSAQWLLVAAARAGARGVRPDEAELQRWVDALIDELDALADENAVEARLFSLIDECEARQAMIPEEFGY